MLKDFKAFILRGNVVDLAVGVVIGAAFGAVITSLVTDVFTPILAIPGSSDFSDLKITAGGSDILYGSFLNVLIAFLPDSGGGVLLHRPAGQRPHGPAQDRARRRVDHPGLPVVPERHPHRCPGAALPTPGGARPALAQLPARTLPQAVAPESKPAAPPPSV